MNPSLDQLPLLLSQLLDSYGRLLSEESRRLDCYLSRDLEAADALRISEERIVEDIRNLHAGILELTEKRSLGDLLREGEAPLGEARDHLGALNRTVQEVQQAVDRSRRFIFNSLSFSEAILRPLLGEESGHYDGEGFLQTGRHRVARRGVRA
jgi:predicted DNA-binding protein YlxM (UPF0122 family)